MKDFSDIENRAVEIIKDNDLNISMCRDGLFIVESWDDLNMLVALLNSIPVEYVNYGTVDKDRVLDNDKKFSNIDSMLQEWGFSDEYACCHICGDSVRIQPDSFNWIPYYWISEDGIICGECINSNESIQDEYIESIINNPKKANIIIDEKILENIGFERCVCNEVECIFESGFCGHEDNPNIILKNAISRNPDKEYIFEIINMEMFRVEYIMWSRNKRNE